MEWTKEWTGLLVGLDWIRVFGVDFGLLTTLIIFGASQRSKESWLGRSYWRIIPPNIRPKRLPQIFLLIPHFEGASSTWGSFLYMRKLPPMWGIILSCGESSHVAQAIFISFYSLKVKRRCWFHWFWVLRISLCRYRPRGSKGSFLQRRNIPLPKEYSSPKGIFLLKRKLPY